MARSEEYKNAKRVVLGNLYNPGSSKNWEIVFFIINVVPYLGKPAFLILRNENMRVPWPGDCAENSKLKNVGFWLSPHFADLLYINSRYTAMAA